MNRKLEILIYVLVVVLMGYNVFFRSIDEKEKNLNVLRTYLSVHIPNDSKLLNFRGKARNGTFIAYAEMEAPNKNIETILSSIKKMDWEIVEQKSTDSENIYYFYTSDLSYRLSDYKYSNRWEESVNGK